MQNRASRIGCLAILCLTTQALLAHKELEPKDQAEAIQWVEDALASYSGVKNIKVTEEYATWANSKGAYGLAFARLTNITFRAAPNHYSPHCVVWQDYAHDKGEQNCWINRRRKEAERFSAALEYLAPRAHDKFVEKYVQQLEGFEPQAKTWREAVTKPNMPEAAREHQVLAEYAFKEKDTDKAIQEYISALDVFPTWPEGQFNLATLAGEKKYYELAVLHMKEYLELVPDSSDAQAAKDSVIIWKDKLAHIYPQSENASDAQPGKATVRDTSAKSY
jgi:hypothetical protein